MGTSQVPSSNGLPPWWRWVVLAATFYMNAIVNGYTYCFGLLKIPLEEEYPEVSPMLLASIGGAIASIYMFLAPFAIAVQEYFGARVTTIGASLLSFACFVITWLNGLYFHAGFFLDLIMLGIGQGIALGFLYGPSVSLLPDYFPLDQLAFAAGVTNAGTSFGVIIFGFMTNPLFSAYGWRGTMLFYALFPLHGIIAAMAFATMKPARPPAKRSEPSVLEKSIIRLSKRSSAKVEAICEDPPTIEMVEKTDALSPVPNVDSEKGAEKEAEKAPDTTIKTDEDEITVEKANPPEIVINTVAMEKLASPPPQSPAPAPTKTTEEPPERSFLEILGRFFDLKLFLQWPFIMMLSAAGFSIIGYFVPSTLIPGHAKDPKYGVTPILAKNIMVIFGILNLTGRFILGKVGDFGFKYAICTSYSLYVGSLVISAAAMFIFPHLMQFGDVFFVAFVVIYGFAAAPIITMRSVLTINLFGKANASAAYGWFVCAQGAVQMIGFILPAWLNSHMGPVAPYSFASFSFLIAAFSCAVTAKPFFAERRKQIAELKAKAKEESIS